MNDLTTLVQSAQAYPDLLAGCIATYQARHHLDDQNLSNYLGLDSVHQLHLLSLCEKPRTDSLQLFLWGAHGLVAYIGCDPLALLRVVNTTPIHLVWVAEEAEQVWRCVLSPYQASVISVATDAYTAYVDGPQGRTWATKQYNSFNDARCWCELTLDEAVLVQPRDQRDQV